jgi:hypothetical protein
MQRRSQWFALGVVLLVTVAALLQTASFDFAYDDFFQIVYNPRIQSWSSTWSNFTSHVWAHTGDQPLYYRPVFMLWLTANHALFGLNPLFWHLMAIALYVFSCILLFCFGWRLTNDRWIAIVAVLLFGLHPGHVEAVAWISGATEPLLAVFLLGSLLCYMKQRDSRDPGMTINMVASLVLACLAVLTKETALIIPGLIFSYELAFHHASSWKERMWPAMRSALPYIPVSIGFLAVRALVLKGITPLHTTVGLRSVLLAWPQVIVFYTRHMLVPFHLSVFYNPLLVSHPGVRSFILPLLIASAGAASMYYGSRRSRVFAFLSMWCVVLLIPLLNVTLWNNFENVHDRYLYLPSIAYCLMLVMVLSRLKEMQYSKSVLAVLVAITAGYIFLTEHESQYWRSDYELGQHGITISPGHPIALQLVGNAYIRQGRTAEAIPWLVDSLQANPDNVQTLCSLSFCYFAAGALTLAEETVAKALALNGAEPRAHLLLGIVRLKQNRLAEAENEIRHGIQLQNQLTPGTAVLYHSYLGDVLYAKGDLRGAASEYRLELRNDPAMDPAVPTARARIDEIDAALGR